MENRLDRLCDKSKGAGQGKSAMQAPLVTGLKRVLVLSVPLLGLVVAACATVTVDSAPEVKQKVVAERAQARWQALMKGDLDAAYAFLSPASKKATPLMDYARTIKPGMWREVKVDKVNCEAEAVQGAAVSNLRCQDDEGDNDPGLGVLDHRRRFSLVRLSLNLRFRDVANIRQAAWGLGRAGV